MPSIRKRFEDTIKYLTEDELEKLQKTVQASEPRNCLILLMLYDSGMRVGELVTTLIEEIDNPNRSIRIPLRMRW